MEEIWKPIPICSGYQASNQGRIIGRRGRILIPTKNYAGYLVFSMRAIQYRVNRIVCLTFHGDPPSSQHHAAHKDSDRQNNRADNLYWATPQENSNDLTKTGNLNGACGVLSQDDVVIIKELYAKGQKIVRIAEKYPHVGYGTISHIIHGRTWRHVHV